MSIAKRAFWLGAVAPVAIVLAATPTFARQSVTAFSIPAGPLSGALRLLTAQSGEQILYDADLVAGYKAPALTDTLVVDEALRRLLAGNGLQSERTSSGVLIIRRTRLAGQVSDAPVSQVEDIVVTGSLLRGALDGPSPVIVVSRDEIDRQGYASVAQTLAALPQNFGGTGNEAALQNGADSSATNASYASGVNLRGLGSDATLVLVNGRRMGGSGAKADFADISTLPTAAIERIEVLLDGASALYGADAVGGVVNIILKKDFEGAETRARVGSVARGSSSEFSAAQTMGRHWSGGGALVSYEYLDREALPVSERERAGDADLRRFGGSDRRLMYSHPGNIVAYDPAVGAYVPRFAIPSNQNGVGLTPGSFLPGQVNLQNHREGLNVLGRQTRHSLFAAANQDIGDSISVMGDLRYGRRKWDTVSLASSTVLTVNDRNPFFVSPTGATSHQIAYSYLDDVGAAHIFGESESLGASVGADLRLRGDWRLSGYLAYARDISDGRVENQINSTHVNEALGRLADNPATSYSAARDGYFNPFGDGSVNTQAVIDFISDGRTQDVLEADVTSANLQLDGTVYRLPGGDAKIAVGLNARREVQGEHGYSFTSGVAPSPFVPRSAERNVSAAFIEARVPMFGPGNRRPGLERLELSVAGRYENYDDIGSTANPKFGLLWSPVSDIITRVSYGTSFRAPALVELHEQPVNSPTVLPRGSAQAVTMIQYGGNPLLQPEEAKSWTAGIEYRPPARPGVRVALNWFETSFDKRIGRPALDNVLNALNDPTLTPFIQFISPGTNAADRAALQAIFDSPNTFSSGLFPMESYGAILDARYVNTNTLVVEGIDLTGSWRFERGRDAFVLGGNVSHLLRYDSQATPTSPVLSRLDTPNNPVGLRARTHADWARGDWGVGIGLNYVDRYRDLKRRRIEAWTTADLQVRYTPDAGRFAGITGTLTVQNLFDEDPPFYDAPQGIAYDAANANVLGRFVAFQVSRRW